MGSFTKNLRRAFDTAAANWPTVKAKAKARLDIAAVEGNLYAMKEIIALYPGEALNWQDAAQLTPLHWAAIGKRGNIVNWLLEQGASLELQDKQGLTALHYAAQASEPEATEQLIAAKAQLETRNNKGETPLMFAVERNKPWNARLLVLAGADVHAANNNGETPLSLARKYPDAEMRDTLEAALQERAKTIADAEKALRAKQAALIAEAAQTMVNGTSTPMQIKKPIRFKNDPLSP